MVLGTPLNDDEKEFAELLLTSSPDELLQDGMLRVLVRSVYEDTLDVGLICIEEELSPDDPDIPDGIGLTPIAILLTPAVKDFFFDKLKDPFTFYGQGGDDADVATPPELPRNGETAGPTEAG